MVMKKLTIGLFGFGVVGEGIYNLLSDRKQLNCSVKKICIKDPLKKRNAPTDLFTTNPGELLKDPEINVIVELIDDADAAWEIARKAMISGKHVVSANKKMIAENLGELLELQHASGVSFLYEAAVCGSIPIIRNLEEYFDSISLTSVTGIVNGSTNFILSQMSENGGSYEETLRIAQDEGFAESDPSLDVEGVDAAYKLSILILHSFGRVVDTVRIPRKGITALHPFDFQFAREKGKKIKLIASSGTDGANRLHFSILPAFVDKVQKLGGVDNENNGVIIGTDLADEQFLFGKGAGRYPTSSAVLSDISALGYDYRYGYKKIRNNSVPSLDSGLQTGRFYLSFPTGSEVDLSLFDEIEETYRGKDRGFAIGTLKHDNLEKYDFWKDDSVSLISFHN